jgi:class 3 adenylate cyclase
VPVPAAPAALPVAERRIVSVLFADLVGFTAASESRDAEDTRELLTRYFDLARTLVTRYGGTLEKFIGDAVMAVWGRRRGRTTPSGPSAPRSTWSPRCPTSTRNCGRAPAS